MWKPIHTIITIILVIIILIMGIVIIVREWSFRKPPITTSTPQKQQKKSETPSTSASKYSNSILGVSLELPSAFHVAQNITEQSPTFIAVTYDEAKVNVSPEAAEAVPPGVKITIAYEQNEANITVEDYAGQVFSGQDIGPSISFQSVSLAGHQGLKKELSSADKSEVYYFIPVKERIYVIHAFGEPNAYKQNSSAIQKLIDSIKFL